ncbi:LON peptidase N-terminal domain and RING finger protein 1-like [Diadema antillarum]|uniref:LON peptidase N-terminal domain and RING finger protein 1-like n=1 Tax=Diadema antillarum TaxID=105358 RepID=UPI003A8B22DE
MELVDLAKEAFKCSNFELASDLFDRVLEKRGQNIEILLMKGDSLANMGRLNEAISAYSHAFRMGDISSDNLHGFVNALVKNLQRPGSLTGGKRTQKQDLGKFSCSMCWGLLSKPTTLSCGHTFCKSCLDHQSKRSCNICCFPYGANTGRCKKLNLNVVVSDVILKYFPNEVRAQEIKAEGNELFKLGRHAEALEKYTLAIRTAPGDHLCLSNRSHAYATQAKFTEALQDAVKVCKMRPNWAKGFYRKGSALVGLNRNEEAMAAFLQCLTLDPSIHSAKVSLTKVLHTLLQPVDATSVKINSLQNSLPTHAFSLGLPDLGSVVKSLGNGKAGEKAVSRPHRTSPVDGGEVDDDGEDCASADGREQEAEEEDEESARSDEDSGKQVPLTPSKILGRRKLSTVEGRNTKKRLPSQSDDYLGADVCFSSTRQTSPDIQNNSKRFKQCPRSPLSEDPEKEVPDIKPGPGYEVPVHLIEKTDFECSLCLRLLNQPTTTPCGHTFCRGCLDRCLDYSQACPLCKQSLSEYQAEGRKNVTILLQELMEIYLPGDVLERQLIHRKELEAVASHSLVDGGEIPVFVCTIALPTIPCPLHVFEPRYRLMIRQVMESGARQFGMCASDEENEFAEFGCMLEINQLAYLPDGRCVLGTVGGRRFKVLERGMRDGYNTAKVEFIKDTIAEGTAATELRALDNAVYQQARTWFVNLPIYHQTRIVDHFGPMPQQASDPQASFNGPQWHWWLLAILPLHQRVQLSVMSKGNLTERLQALQRSLTRMTNLPS